MMNISSYADYKNLIGETESVYHEDLIPGNYYFIEDNYSPDVNNKELMYGKFMNIYEEIEDDEEEMRPVTYALFKDLDYIFNPRNGKKHFYTSIDAAPYIYYPYADHEKIISETKTIDYNDLVPGCYYYIEDIFNTPQEKEVLYGKFKEIYVDDDNENSLSFDKLEFVVNPTNDKIDSSTGLKANDYICYPDKEKPCKSTIETVTNEAFDINTVCFDVIGGEDVPIVEFLKDKDNIVIVLYDNDIENSIKIGLIKERIHKLNRIEHELDYHKVYACKNPSSIIGPRNVIKDKVYFDIKKLCGFGDLIEFDEFNILSQLKHNIYIFKKTYNLITTVSDDVLNNRVRNDDPYVLMGARHCQSGQNAKVYKLQPNIELKFSDAYILLYDGKLTGGRKIKTMKKNKRHGKTKKTKRHGKTKKYKRNGRNKKSIKSKR